MDINSIINVPSTDSPPKLPKILPEMSMSQPSYHGSKVPARRLSTKDGKQKSFQCTGFGDCKMIFTRSEHLARHARKHTGEKPFQCIVPSCNRMFSRFDNMMQHTQTHSHRRDHSKQPIVLDADIRRLGRKSSVSSNSSISSSVSELSSPQPQPAKSHPLQIPPSPVSPHNQHRYLPPLTIPPPNHHPSWSTPLPVSPVSPISPYSSSSYTSIPSLAPLSMSSPPLTHSRSVSQPGAPPPRISRHGPRTASDPTPFIYAPPGWFEDHVTPPPTSPMGGGGDGPPVRTRTGRRLSIADLCNPIETLMQPAAVRGAKEGAIEITEDEMEALLGFSQFHCYPVKKEEMG